MKLTNPLANFRLEISNRLGDSQFESFSVTRSVRMIVFVRNYPRQAPVWNQFLVETFNPTLQSNKCISIQFGSICHQDRAIVSEDRQQLDVKDCVLLSDSLCPNGPGLSFSFQQVFIFSTVCWINTGDKISRAIFHSLVLMKSCLCESQICFF